MAVKIFIDGQAGTTGLRIHERLADRKDLTMITLTEETRKDPEARRAAILESDERSCGTGWRCGRADH